MFLHIFLSLFTFKVEMHCFALNGEQCSFAQEKQNVSQMVISKPLFSIFIHFYTLSLQVSRTVYTLRRCLQKMPSNEHSLRWHRSQCKVIGPLRTFC